MIRAYRYRLRPTRAQEIVLLAWLKATRELYNAALQERRDAWQKQRVSVSRYDQQGHLAAIRADSTIFAAVPLVVLRGALRRIDLAFQAFFRRCKSGEKPGYPRFRSRDRWESLTLDDLNKTNPITAGGRRVKIPFLGTVKCFAQDRMPRGTPKAMRIRRDASGHWILTLACVNVPTQPFLETGNSVGVDVGLHHFAATSDGDLFRNPRVLDAQRIVTERAARRLARRKKGSQRRRNARRLLAQMHARTANLRREHHIGVARLLVAKYDTIYVEDLNVKGLARSNLARSVNDAAWGNFLHWVHVKAESAGRVVVKVDPRGTSQRCSDCAVVVAKSLAERVHRCFCGLVLDRDVNAARNIKGLGLALRGAATLVRVRRRSAKPKSPTADRSILSAANCRARPMCLESRAVEPDQPITRDQAAATYASEVAKQL